MGGSVLINSSKPKVLITGGAGFIGFHLARELHQQGYPVTIADNLSRGKMDAELQELISTGVVFKKIDFTNKEELAQLDNDYEHVYHLAAVNGTRFFYEIPHIVLKVDILAVINVLDWFLTLSGDKKKKKIIFASTSETYAAAASFVNLPYPTPETVPLAIDDPYNLRWSYGASKMLGELFFISYWKKMGVQMSIVRYANIYGPRMGYEHVIPEFMVRILQKEDPFPIHGGENTRTFCYVTDAVRASQLIMESPKTDGEIINIGTDQGELPMTELAEKLFALTGYHPVSVAVHPAPKGSILRRCPDVSKLHSLTGFSASVSLDAGLQLVWDWYRLAYQEKKK